MKIRYASATKDNSNPYAMMRKAKYIFSIEESILKTHYKQLARMSFLFSKETRNEGYILSENVENFLALIEKIEKSSDKRCATSHKKSLEKKKKSYQKSISFEDYCEDQFDLSVDLMSDSEKNEYYESYLKGKGERYE